MLELFRLIAEKAGVASLPGFIELTASPQMQALKEVKIDPEIEKAINSNLINVEVAKTHKDIVNHIKGQELGKIDEQTKKLYKDAGFSDDVIKEAMSVGSTGDKVVHAIKLFKEQALKNSKTDDSDKVKVLIADNQELQNKVLQTQKEWEGKYNGIKGDFSNYQLKSELTKRILNHPLRKDMTLEHITLLAESEINKELSIVDGRMSLSNSGINVLSKDADTPLLNKQKGVNYNFDEFLSGVLAKNNFLEVAKPNPGNPVPIAAGGAGKAKGYFPSSYDENLKKEIQASI